VSVQAIAAVLEGSEATGVARMVLIVLANHESDHDGESFSFPSIDTIAREARCSRRTVIGALVTLADLGELVVERNAGPRGTNRYHVSVTWGGADSAPVQISDATLHPNRKEPRLTSSSEPKGSSELAVSHADIFGSLLEACGLADSRLTDRHRRNIGALARDLLGAGYTTDDIARGGELYREVYDVVPTPAALEKHLPRLLAGHGRPIGDGRHRAFTPESAAEQVARIQAEDERRSQT
jgi:helix-turn-helix protein